MEDVMAKPARPAPLSRRLFLATTAVGAVFLARSGLNARSLPGGAMPWDPYSSVPPTPVRLGPWEFFTDAEGRAVEAMVARLIPADELSPVSGKDAGCAVFIDRQLAGFYGDSRRLYLQPPFMKGTPEQGDQSGLTPRDRYRRSLAAIDAYCRGQLTKPFVELDAAAQDDFLTKLEKGGVQLPGDVEGTTFFDLLLTNTMEGFFADPIYGGNRDMVSWKLLGFPGARYDFRDHIEKHNERYPHPPVSILGRVDWTVRG